MESKVWVTYCVVFVVMALSGAMGYSAGYGEGQTSEHENIVALQSELRKYQGNDLDPTLLEVAISEELNSKDSYDIHLHYWAGNLSSDYLNFEITGKAAWERFDLSQID